MRAFVKIVAVVFSRRFASRCDECSTLPETGGSFCRARAIPSSTRRCGRSLFRAPSPTMSRRWCSTAASASDTPRSAMGAPGRSGSRSSSTRCRRATSISTSTPTATGGSRPRTALPARTAPGGCRLSVAVVEGETTKLTPRAAIFRLGATGVTFSFAAAGYLEGTVSLAGRHARRAADRRRRQRLSHRCPGPALDRLERRRAMGPCRRAVPLFVDSRARGGTLRRSLRRAGHAACLRTSRRCWNREVEAEPAGRKLRRQPSCTRPCWAATDRPWG